jgi:glycerol-3-phosphate dehydrogenase (NAD(P)+)
MSDSSINRVTVVGAGGMGTLCALLLAERGIEVALWGRSPEQMAQLAEARENLRYLPGHPLSQRVTVTSSPAKAIAGTSLIVSAVPCQFMRPIWERLSPDVPPNVPIVSVAKGLEIETRRFPTQIIQDCVGDVVTACLSGPCIAPEVADKKPTGVVVASRDERAAQLIQRAFSSSYFRVYTSTDLTGVELGGAVKNVIAIAAGISDGIGAGDNAKAALLTRGLVEIRRLGTALGARPETLSGLAGLGDLVTTCISRVGRNRSAGERIGRGESAQSVMASTVSVIEGIPTTRSVLELAARHNVELPIVAAMASVLFEGRRPADAIEELMTRPLRSEEPM